jgi:hypothetical protein
MNASNTCSPTVTLCHPKIIASTPDPLYTDDLIEVELEFETQLEHSNNIPIVCLNQITKNGGKTILLDSNDLYMTYDNFQQLIFTGLELLSGISKQYQASMTESDIRHMRSIQKSKALIELLKDHVSNLEASYEHR